MASIKCTHSVPSVAPHCQRTTAWVLAGSHAKVPPVVIAAVGGFDVSMLFTCEFIGSRFLTITLWSAATHSPLTFGKEATRHSCKIFTTVFLRVNRLNVNTVVRNSPPACLSILVPSSSPVYLKPAPQGFSKVLGLGARTGILYEYVTFHTCASVKRLFPTSILL